MTTKTSINNLNNILFNSSYLIEQIRLAEPQSQKQQSQKILGDSNKKNNKQILRDNIENFTREFPKFVSQSKNELESSESIEKGDKEFYEVISNEKYNEFNNEINKYFKLEIIYIDPNSNMKGGSHSDINSDENTYRFFLIFIIIIVGSSLINTIFRHSDHIPKEPTFNFREERIKRDSLIRIHFLQLYRIPNEQIGNRLIKFLPGNTEGPYYRLGFEEPQNPNSRKDVVSFHEITAVATSSSIYKKNLEGEYFNWSTNGILDQHYSMYLPYLLTELDHNDMEQLRIHIPILSYCLINEFWNQHLGEIFPDHRDPDSVVSFHS